MPFHTKFSFILCKSLSEPNNKHHRSKTTISTWLWSNQHPIRWDHLVLGLSDRVYLGRYRNYKGYQLYWVYVVYIASSLHTYKTQFVEWFSDFVLEILCCRLWICETEHLKVHSSINFHLNLSSNKSTRMWRSSDKSLKWAQSISDWLPSKHYCLFNKFTNNLWIPVFLHWWNFDKFNDMFGNSSVELDHDLHLYL